MVPVVKCLLIQKKMFCDNSAIKQRNRFVGQDHKCPAKVFIGSAKVIFPVILLAPLEVSSGKINQERWRVWIQLQGAAQSFDCPIVLAFQQVSLGLGL